MPILQSHYCSSCSSPVCQFHPPHPSNDPFTGPPNHLSLASLPLPSQRLSKTVVQTFSILILVQPVCHQRGAQVVLLSNIFWFLLITFISHIKTDTFPIFQMCFTSLPHFLLSTWNPPAPSNRTVPPSFTHVSSLLLQLTFISLLNLDTHSNDILCMKIPVHHYSEADEGLGAVPLWPWTPLHLITTAELSNMSCATPTYFRPEPYSALCFGLSPDLQRHNVAPSDM